MGFCSVTCQKWTTICISLICVVFGVWMVFFWRSCFDTILKHELSLTNSRTMGFIMWKETPIPMYLDFYMWNWTNPDEILENGWKNTKPKFEQCGPYVYLEKHIRERVIFNDNNNTITYNTRRVWHFVPEKSNGSIEDKITTVNPMIAIIGFIIRDKHIIVKRGVNFFIEDKLENLVVTKTVDEFLFKGYNDPLLRLAQMLNIKGFDIPFDKFGWFYGRNDSVDYDGIFNMNTGSDDIQKLGRLQMWNYSSAVKYFDGSCGQVSGTSGELWYPPKDDPEVTVFASDACSTVVLKYKEEFTFNGIVGKKYVGGDNIFDNGSIYPEMGCFVPQGASLASGVRNISRCKYGAPAFISFPHFYLADPSYSDVVEGMHPDVDLHTFYIALEPNTGLPLKVNAAFQVNIKMAPLKGIDLLENVTTIYVPILWFNQRAELSKSLSDEGRILIALPSVGYYLGFGVLGIGIFLLFVIGVVILRKHFKGFMKRSLCNR